MPKNVLRLFAFLPINARQHLMRLRWGLKKLMPWQKLIAAEDVAAAVFALFAFQSVITEMQ